MGKPNDIAPYMELRCDIVNQRELFQEVMFYGDFDRLPVWYTDEWTETAEEWIDQGLPLDTDRLEFFNAVSFPWTVPTHLGRDMIGSWRVGIDGDVGMRAFNMLYPEFPEEILEETDDYQIVRQDDGVIAKVGKHGSSIPHYIDYTFKDSSGWDEYKWRLQPNPARPSNDIYQILASMRDHDHPMRVRTGSLIGVIRNWMGVENLAFLSHDDPDLICEIVDTISDLVCWELDQILPKVQIDMGWAWEDICARSGPLASPKIFERCVVPGYQKIAGKLLEYGVKLFGVDSDGKLDALIPVWLEGGVNVLYPIEIGTWGTDPMELRKRFGKELRLIGGINKLEFLKGPAAIDAEIERRLPLIHEGGYIPSPDHQIVPGTPLKNVQYYLERIRELRF